MHACENTAGLVVEDPYGVIREGWEKRYGGDFTFSENPDHFCSGSRVLTVDAVVGWTNCFVDLPEGEQDIAREVFNGNRERTLKVLDQLDEEFKESCSRPSQAFRDWMDNEFKTPTHLASLLGRVEEFATLDKLQGETPEAICEELEAFTGVYREKFGGSKEHPCLYCHLNHPCFGCGEQFPVQNFVDANIDGKFETITRGGVAYAGRWKMGCSVVLVRDCGLHLCWACAMKHTKYRARSVNSKRKKRAMYEAAVALNASGKKGERTRARLKRNYDKFQPYPSFTPLGGVFKNETLQLRVSQDGKAIELQPQDCTLPHTVEMTRSNGDVVCAYTSGKGRSKKSNGCSKVNRKRLHNAKALATAMGDAFAEMDREEEEEREAVERLENERADAKRAWISTKAAAYERDWVKRSGSKFSNTVSLDDQLHDCFTTDFQFAFHEFVRGERNCYVNKLWKQVDAFETIEAYHIKQAENATDMAKYGKVIDTDVIFDRIDNAASSAPVELMDGIALAKKRMIEARIAYDSKKRQKKCS